MALITNLQPAAGDPVAADGVVSFDVIDPVIAELRVFVWAVFAVSGAVELVYDGSFFQPTYSTSTIASTPGGRKFFIRRVSGWPSQPSLRVDTCACPPTVSSGSGETNTASNLGTGARVFSTKVGVDLRFRSLTSTDLSVGITEGADAIDFSTNTKSWAQVLAVGAESGAQSPLISSTQIAEWGYDSGLANPCRGWRTARRFDDVGPGLGVFSDMETAINTSPPNANSRILVRAVCSTQQGAGAPFTTGWAILEEVWDVAPTARIRTVISEHSGATSPFQFVVDGDDVVLQVEDLVDGEAISAYAMIDVVQLAGEP